MGKKRYYCDYCQKHFADNPQTRKKHNAGIQHCNAKRIHYDKFKGAEELLKEDEKKEPCRRFMSTGECQYGDACRHSHITPDIRKQLLDQVLRDKGLLDTDEETEPQVDVQEWLQKNGLGQDISVDEHSKDQQLSIKHVADRDYELPECLRGIADLPPSLLPPQMRAPKLNLEPPLGWGE